jgi:hypothetical protein
MAQAACLYATQAHAWEDTGTAQCPVETMVQHSHGGEFCVPIILTLSLALRGLDERTSGTVVARPRECMGLCVYLRVFARVFVCVAPTRRC